MWPAAPPLGTWCNLSAQATEQYQGILGSEPPEGIALGGAVVGSKQNSSPSSPKVWALTVHTPMALA